MDGSVRLIVNPSAGGGRAARALPQVEAALRDLGLEFSTHRTTGLEHADDLARQAVADGARPVAFGGDGLAGCVAHAVRGGPVAMGLLPGGRGNDFVRKLGIPSDPVAACRLLADGTERAVDVAEVDGRTFVGIASFGLDSDVQEIALRSRVPGGLVYLASTLRALRRWEPVRLRFAADGGPEREVLGYAVAACNSGMFGGGMALAPDASLDDGQLDVVVTGDASKARFLRNLPRVFRGTHLDEPGVELFRARELRVDAERPFAVWADGDPIGSTPATIRAVPGALRILVP